MIDKIQSYLQAILEENYREMSNIVRAEIGSSKIAELIKANGNHYKIELIKTVANILLGNKSGNSLKIKDGDTLLLSSGQEYISYNNKWHEVVIADVENISNEKITKLLKEPSVFEQDIKSNEDKIKKGICPECDSALVYESGCRSCPNLACGFAVCGG